MIKSGLIFFSDKIEKYIPPKKGRDHVLHMVRDLLMTEPAHRKTNISQALKFLNNTLRQKTITFLLSDFLDENYEEALRVAAANTISSALKCMTKWIWNCLMPD